MQLYSDNLEFAPNRPTQGYSVGGELYVSIVDTYFPQEHWYDMVWFDLKNWIPGLISFGYGHSDSCMMTFMDGPFSVRLTRTDTGLIRAVCQRGNIAVVSQAEIDFTQFIRSVIACCQKYDRFLFIHGKICQFSDEIRILKTILTLKT